MDTNEFLIIIVIMFGSIAPFLGLAGILMVSVSTLPSVRFGERPIANELLAIGSFLVLVPFCLSLLSRMALGVFWGS